MYKYVEDKQFLSCMRSLCGEIMQDLCHTLKEEYDIGASFYLVGSGARNLILQNANQPIDLDILKSQELMIGKIAKKSKNVSERLSILFLENMGGVTAKILPHL